MKKTKKFLSWLAAAAIVFNAASLSFAQSKRDVNDPVLREIINELSKKMPKFINKYGETVFVEDEPITRGALITAIYEYDRRTKSQSETAAPAVSQITKQEFEALRAKVAALEKSSAASAKSPSKSDGNVDMIALIADLEPNMPALLDNSLKQSKVFMDLQRQIAAGGRSSGKEGGVSYASVAQDIADMNAKLEQMSIRLSDAESALGSSNKTAKVQRASQASQKEIDELRNTLIQIQQSYVRLSKRVDELDAPALAASSEKGNNNVDMSYINRQLSDIKRTVADVPTSAEIRNEISRSKNQTQADIERIERRLNTISAPSKYGDSSGSGATIATISLGITMIAALFVAR
ncbi:MAG: hypothetical protein FWG57_03555 [Endomicrobia bacterium]|nr:hypothetical protein [Endomicrobiia bacterium]